MQVFGCSRVSLRFGDFYFVLVEGNCDISIKN